MHVSGPLCLGGTVGGALVFTWMALVVVVLILLVVAAVRGNTPHLPVTVGLVLLAVAVLVGIEAISPTDANRKSSCGG